MSYSAVYFCAMFSSLGKESKIQNKFFDFVQKFADLFYGLSLVWFFIMMIWPVFDIHEYQVGLIQKANAIEGNKGNKNSPDPIEIMLWINLISLVGMKIY